MDAADRRLRARGHRARDGQAPLHGAPRRPCRCGERACERRGGVPRLGRGDGGRARARAAARRGRYGEPRGGISGAARPRRRQGAVHRARRICRQRESLPRRGGGVPPPHDGDVPGGQAGADVSGCAPSARRHSGNTPVQLSADPLGEKAGVRAGCGQQLHSQAVAAHPGGVPAAWRGAARGRSPGGRAQRRPGRRREPFRGARAA